MAWLRWFVCSMSIAAIALLPFGDALAQGNSDCPKGSIIPHPHDCQKYLECLEEKLLLLTCDNDMYFDAATGDCTDELPASCSHRKDTMEVLDGSYLGRAVVEPCRNYRPGFKLAHPEDCSRFFQCTQKGGAALFRCPANLLFHSAMKVCVWPQQVVCEPGTIIPPPPTPVPPPGPGTGGGDNEGNDGADDDRPVEICEPSCILDFRCPLDCDPIKPAEVFPHPSRCDAYLRCNSAGYSCETVCPPGMWFSNILRRCAYADLVQECVPVNRPICDDPICLPNPDCPEIDTVPPTKLPFPGNNNKYYICRDGSACEMRCPPGLEWNVLERECDFPFEDPGTPEPETTTTLEPETTTTTTLAPETTTTTTLAPETTTTTTLAPETTTTSTLAPVTTTTTTLAPETTTTTTLAPVTTTTTTLAPETTTTTTLAPVTTTTTTLAPVTTTTTIQPPTPGPPPTTTTEGDCPTCPPSNCVPDSRCPLCEKCIPTYFPHEDCDKFYKCNFGLICEMKCPPGLHFNARENVCDWPALAGCDGPPPIEDPPENAVCQPNPSCPPNDSSGNVFLPHPNCGLYYKCSWGNACLKECPNGLHWSMQKNRCEWPFLAGCDPNLPPNDPSCPTCPCFPCRSNRNACHPSLRCPPSWMTGVTASFGHEHHCNQFYECLSGQACALECPAGLEYSGGAGRCDVPSNSMCSLQWK
uniref:Chitin-binding type-2 domain-containing protein n=1 Tax=Anopheles atroparvus TaxID=41427 RepID=A0AAG5DLD2_ANOAO